MKAVTRGTICTAWIATTRPTKVCGGATSLITTGATVTEGARAAGAADCASAVGDGAASQTTSIRVVAGPCGISLGTELGRDVWRTTSFVTVVQDVRPNGLCAPKFLSETTPDGSFSRRRCATGLCMPGPGADLFRVFALQLMSTARSLRFSISVPNSQKLMALIASWSSARA